ncbi:hypothetical protein D3C87_971900 [compost metagenome]
MPKKTLEKYQFIKNVLQSSGYTIKTTEEEYLTAKGRDLTVICEKHGDFFTNYSKAKKSCICKKCSNENLRLTIDKVVEYLNSRGFKIRDLFNYSDGNSEIYVECKNGHTFFTTYNKIYNGGCLDCSNINRRKSSTELTNLFKDNGFQIIKGLDTYKDKDSRMIIECALGHQYETTYGSFGYSGKKCAICKNVKPHTLDFVTDMFISKGLIPMFFEYINLKTPLKFKCPQHLDIIQQITYLQLVKNVGCRLCGRERISGENHYCWKGGVSSFNDFLRRSIIPWKEASLKHHGYKCVISEETEDLDIHHALVNFSDIAQEVISNLSLSELILKSEIAEINKTILSEAKALCLQLHMDYGFGIPLRKDIHKSFHIEYGYHNNTYEQFLEFKSKYIHIYQ